MFDMSADATASAVTLILVLAFVGLVACRLALALTQYLYRFFTLRSNITYLKWWVR